MTSKRVREHDLAVSLSSKRAYVGDVNPGREYVEPKIYQQPQHEAHGSHVEGTNFATWTEAQIKAFLDARGGDYDDCGTFEQLVERAVETEVNTGPAPPPHTYGGAAGAGDDGGAGAAAAGAAAGGAENGPGGGGGGGEEDDDYDPLEAFMAGIDEEVAANKPGAVGARPDAGLACDDEADPATEYMEARQAAGHTAAQAIAADVAAAGYDSDEEVYATAKAMAAAEEDDEAAAGADPRRRAIDPLAPLDHGAVDYDDFAKDFYSEHPTVAAMTEAQVNAYRRQLDVRVAGFDPPKPVQTFGQCGFDHSLLGAIKRAGYDAPTAIQAQALPAALSGRDVLGLAKTGSGKTAAFVLPMLVHIMDQPEVTKGQGPIGLVLAPTRELAEQIHKEARKFAKPYGLRVCAAFGGLSKFDQVKELKAGTEAAIATPGRMIDLIKMKACTLSRVTFVVLDEADRMFDMGFEQQVRSLMGQVRPERQVLLFSATMPKKVERLVGDVLSNPVRVSVGQTGAANEDVSQHVEVLTGGEAAKRAWLLGKLQSFIDEGDVLVFAGQRAKVEELVAALQRARFKAAGIHGDMDQFARMAVLDAYRAGQHHVLVATDVAARGLDIRTIRTVVNYDAPKDIDTHIHRVGRTGRAGDKDGNAWTLLEAGKHSHFAGQLVQSLALAGQEVPQALHALAMKDPRFRKGSSRHKGKGGGDRGRKNQPGGTGLGFGGGAGAGTAGSAAAAAAMAGVPHSKYGGGGGGEGGDGGGSGDGGMSFSLSSKAPAATGRFVQLPGFAQSSEKYEQESSAAAAVRAPRQQPPLPPSPPHQQQQPAAAGGGADSPPPPLPPDEPPPLPPPPAAAAATPMPAKAPAVTVTPPLRSSSGGGGGAGGSVGGAGEVDGGRPKGPGDYRQELLKSVHQGHFNRSFVSSGVRGGDVGTTATIVMPKQSAQKPGVPPPPVPVSQRPLYLQRQNQPTIMRTKGGAPQPQQQQQQQPAAPLSAAQSAAAAAALAAAQAIAARLAAQAPGAGGAPPPRTSAQAASPSPPLPLGGGYEGGGAAHQAAYPPPPLPQGPPPPREDPPGDAYDPIAAAQAIAARLRAQQGQGQQPWQR